MTPKGKKYIHLGYFATEAEAQAARAKAEAHYQNLGAIQ